MPRLWVPGHIQRRFQGVPLLIPMIFSIENIPVIKLDEELQEACFAGETEPVIRRIQWVLGQNDEEHFILAMPGKRNPDIWK